MDTPAHGYEILSRWFHMVKVKNLGYVTHIEVDSYNKFKYEFLAFGALVRGKMLE